MSIRHRERIRRNTETVDDCEGCGDSMLDTWSSACLIDGEYFELCSTCQSELHRHGEQGLLAYLLAHRRYYPDDVNDQAIAAIRD